MSAARPPRPLSVLVVDDNHDCADSTASLLTLAGFAVRPVYGPEAALRSAAADPPDIVLLDLIMPAMDGWEVARRLRDQAAGRRLLLVAVTAAGRPEDRRRSEEAGFDVHLVKPVDPDVLLDLLRQFAGPAPATPGPGGP